MLDHEIYEVVLERVKTVLSENVVGNVFVEKDDHNYYIWIQTPKMGNFRYAIYGIDSIDYNDLSGDRLAQLVMRWHKERVIKSIFKARNDP